MSSTLVSVDVVADLPDPKILNDPGDDPVTRLKAQLVADYARRRPVDGNRRIALRYLASPVEILGDDRVTGLRIERNRLERSSSGAIRAMPTGDEEVVDTGLVIRSVGYRGRAIPGVPFDDDRGTVPNAEGLVLEDGSPMAGVYTTGWIKRGPSGVIGTNRTCAQETVAQLLADFAGSHLAAPEHTRAELNPLVRERQPDVVDLAGWRSIDRSERQAGQANGSSRRKITTTPELVTAAVGTG